MAFCLFMHYVCVVEFRMVLFIHIDLYKMTNGQCQTRQPNVVNHMTFFIKQTVTCFKEKIKTGSSCFIKKIFLLSLKFFASQVKNQKYFKSRLRLYMRNVCLVYSRPINETLIQMIEKTKQHNVHYTRKAFYKPITRDLTVIDHLQFVGKIQFFVKR